MCKDAGVYKVGPEDKKTICSGPIVPSTPEGRLGSSKTMSSWQAEGQKCVCVCVYKIISQGLLFESHPFVNPFMKGKIYDF